MIKYADLICFLLGSLCYAIGTVIIWWNRAHQG